MSDYITGRGRRADPRRRLRLAALTAVVAGVVLLAIAAFLLSYEGIHSIAHRAGVTSTLAGLYPLIFDAMLVIACAAILALRGAGWLTRVYVWLSLLILLTAVATGDALHAMKIVLPQQPTRAVVAVTPWALLLLGFGLWLAMLRHVRRVWAAGSQQASLAGQPGSPGLAADPASAGDLRRQSRSGRQGRQGRPGRQGRQGGQGGRAARAAGGPARAGARRGWDTGAARSGGDAGAADWAEDDVTSAGAIGLDEPGDGMRGPGAGREARVAGPGAGTAGGRSVVWGSGTGTWTARPAPQPRPGPSGGRGAGYPPAAAPVGEERRRPVEEYPAPRGQYPAGHYSEYASDAGAGDPRRPGYPEAAGRADETGYDAEPSEPELAEDDPAADHSALSGDDRQQATDQAEGQGRQPGAPPGSGEIPPHFQRMRSRPIPPEEWGAERE
jgi:Protein of unknown function (DUF2637)